MFSDSAKIQGAELKNNVYVFYGFMCFLGPKKDSNCHVAGRVVWKAEMWRNLFGSTFVNFLNNISKLKMFTKAVCKYSLTQIFLDSGQILRT